MKPCQVNLRASDFIAVYRNLQPKKKSNSSKAKDKMKKKYQCQKCRRIYAHQSSLNTHKRYECGVEPKFVCDLCGHKSKLKNHIKKHIITVHLKPVKHVKYDNHLLRLMEWSHKCDKCERAYVSKQNLSRHKRFECGVEPKFVCDYCGHKSKQKSHTLRHIVKLHLKSGQNKEGE